ncbi:MAG: 1,4-dihydroxy-2-naphthoate polyprenyltransferase [Deltaproteobacteria bacterium]|nr:1,4-dihydroxy-2-naphthoate polyprenyltransferase [Deltaproteobacteria bacterium]
MTVSIWVDAARPRTLPAAIAPVLIGLSISAKQGAFDAPVAILTLLAALLIQIGTNLANDYFDFVKGADTSARVGPARATQAGLVTPATMRRAFILVFGLAVSVGAFLLARGGWPIALIGALSVAFGVLYTGGPKPLGYLGLGDLLVLAFFGPVAVAGTAYLQSLSFSKVACVAGLAPGLLSTAILAVNNLRDVDTDRQASKRTVAVRFGTSFVRLEYFACLLGAAIVPFVLSFGFGASFGVLSTAALVPLGGVLARRVGAESGAALDPLLGQTGRLLVAYAVAFSVGLWL